MVDALAILQPVIEPDVHRRLGFVVAQCGVSAEDPHLLLQGHAYAEGVTMEEMARDVISGRLAFTATGTTIRDAR